MLPAGSRLFATRPGSPTLLPVTPSATLCRALGRFRGAGQRPETTLGRSWRPRLAAEKDLPLLSGALPPAARH